MIRFMLAQHIVDKIATDRYLAAVFLLSRIVAFYQPSDDSDVSKGAAQPSRTLVM